jgi:hypothetical protein
LELNYSIRGAVRLERSEPSIVNAELRRNQAEAVDAGPSSLFTGTDLLENFTCRHELVDSFGPHMNHGPAIVGHLQQIEAESPKYARFFLCELNHIRNDAVGSFLLILRPLPHFRNGARKNKIVMIDKGILRCSNCRPNILQ